LDGSGGLVGGCVVLASLAKKNLESAGAVPGLLANPPTSELPVLNETVGLLPASLSTTDIPNPGVGVVSCPRNESFDEERRGVPLGVPVGVVLVLSTRIFLEPDLGVILLFKKADTGVEISSLLDGPGVMLFVRGPCRDTGVEAIVAADPATRGVNGGLFDAFADALRVGISGLVELVGLS
jgi:hypothetical protein